MALNLARKWRSKKFNEIVGQPLAVRLVQNSLYRNLLFPVYLLSGTRGTGKTSTARLFAAALNCAQLESFQTDPKSTALPCLLCPSCEAMQQMKHPDFIEIDAASHTGVDNVRQIIDAASFVPVMGKKKIYLIDEAHMLSKAAFNAFLKILEEPPAAAVFMLATTDPHKIIPTVTSRCFQIIFDPIKQHEVVAHLEYICKQESLGIDTDALRIVAQETEGSMRDALNLLERLRSLSDVAKEDTKTITKEMVLSLLGSIDDNRVATLLHTIISGDEENVLKIWQRLELSTFAPIMIWKKLVELLRRALWFKQGSSLDAVPIPPELVHSVEAASYHELVQMLELCYEYELTFAKTTLPSTLLEMLIIKMALTRKQPTQKKGSAALKPIKSSEKPQVPVKKSLPQAVGSQIPVEKKAEENNLPTKKSVSQEVPRPVEAGPWRSFLVELEDVSDPLVLSIFKQSIAHEHVKESATIEVTFSQDLAFFEDWLSNTKSVWQPLIEKFFGTEAQLKSFFTGQPTKQRPIVTAPITSQKNPSKMVSPTKTVQQGKQVKSDDVGSLTFGSAIVDLFPGKLTEHDIPQEGA